MMDPETRRVVETGDAMTAMWREIVGNAAQLRIPLRDPVDLRRCATILRDLANKLEVVSHAKLGADSIMFSAKREVAAAQGRLKSKIRRG
jgi:hypothetical protein